MGLAEADFDYRDFEDRNAGDKALHVRFYLRPVQSATKSAEAGRPIFDDREFVEIRAPGNATTTIDRPVSDMDRARFPRQYALFKAGAAEQVIGTRLTEVPWITRSQVEELSYLKILTVEQLSVVADQACTAVPGLYELKRRATSFLEAAEKAAPFTALAAENTALKNEVETLKQTVKEQGEQITAFLASQQAQKAPGKA
jgi:hypothetical protein